MLSDLWLGGKLGLLTIQFNNTMRWLINKDNPTFFILQSYPRLSLINPMLYSSIHNHSDSDMDLLFYDRQLPLAIALINSGILLETNILIFSFSKPENIKIED